MKYKLELLLFIINANNNKPPVNYNNINGDKFQFSGKMAATGLEIAYRYEIFI